MRQKTIAVLSILVIALGGFVAWQLQNSNPTSLDTQPTNVKNQPVYGISLPDTIARQTPANSLKQLRAIKKLGFRQVRFTISWYIVQPNNAQSYDWKLYDQLMNNIQTAGLQGLAIINYTPAWARQPVCKTSAYCPPAQPAQFAAFAKAVVNRYSKLGLHDYEVWNEENIKSFWQPSPSAAVYATILKATYPAIKQADPQSTVLLGSMSGVSQDSPGYIEPRAYLSDLYMDGIQSYFDVLGYHAYTFPELPSDIDGGKNAWAKLTSVRPSLRSIMVAHGDSKKEIWITEVGAPTDGPARSSQPTAYGHATVYVSDSLQAKIAKDVLDDSTKLPWLGGLFWYTYQDASTNKATTENFYGLLNYDLQPKSSLEVFQKFLQKHK